MLTKPDEVIASDEGLDAQTIDIPQNRLITLKKTNCKNIFTHVGGWGKRETERDMWG